MDRPSRWQAMSRISRTRMAKLPARAPPAGQDAMRPLLHRMAVGENIDQARKARTPGRDFERRRQFLPTQKSTKSSREGLPCAAATAHAPRRCACRSGVLENGPRACPTRPLAPSRPPLGKTSCNPAARDRSKSRACVGGSLVPPCCGPYATQWQLQQEIQRRQVLAQERDATADHACALGLRLLSSPTCDVPAQTVFLLTSLPVQEANSASSYNLFLTRAQSETQTRLSKR